MTIELVSGQPGAGKTLYTIVNVEERARKESRPVYYHGINGLRLGWTRFDDPERWYELPHGAIIVIDECWQWFGKRHYAKAIPPHIQELATHRHKGWDIYFITQGAHLLDEQIKPLVGQHTHIARKWGMEKCTVFKWQRVQEKPDVFQQGATVDVWFFPRDAFGWYVSAEKHTIKRRIPLRVKFMVLSPFLIVGLGFWAYQSLVGKWLDGGEVGKSASEVLQLKGGGQAPGTAVVAAPVSVGGGGEYLSSRVPRVEGLPHTAPRYDDVVGKATTAPYPAICVAASARCQCYSDQGTKVGVPDDICRAIVRDGFYVDWEKKDVGGKAATVPLRPSPAPSALGSPERLAS